MRNREPTAAETEEEEGGLQISDLVRLVRRRIRLVASVAISLGALGSAVVMVLPNRYEAAATVQIDSRKRTIVPIENVQSDLKTDTPIVESEVEVVRSKAVALRVIDKLGLRSDREFAEPGILASIFGRLGLNTWYMQKATPAQTERRSAPQSIEQLLATGGPGPVEPDYDEVASAFLSKVKVNRVRNSLVIEIRVNSKDPVKAARIANALGEAYIQDQIDTKTKATGTAAEILEQKLEGLRQQLYEAERRIAQFKTDNNIVDAEGQILSEKQLARLMEQTVYARNNSAETRAKAEQVYRLMQTGSDRSGLGEVLSSHTVKMLKEQLAKVAQQSAEVSTRYGDKHPQMVKVQAEVAELQGKIDREVAQIAANIRAEADVAAARELELGEALDRLKQQQVVMRDATVRLRELEREAQTSRQIFEAFLGRYKQTAETQDMQLPDSRFVERADVPLYPVAPRRMQLMMAIGGGALAFAIGLALLIELAAPGLRKPEEVEQVLAVSHLASVPMLGQRQLAGGARNTARLILSAPNSAFAEAIRTARREIDAVRISAAPRVILVASTLPNEGKSLLASNLAHQYAIAGVRTLLMDADMRKAQLSHRLGVVGERGLIDVLAGRIAPEPVLVTDVSTGLSMMPAFGRFTADLAASELLASARFGQMLAALKMHFEVIVVDAPPLLPVVDARIVADHADQIAMTMLWRRTPKQLAKRAIKTLGPNAAKIAGVMVNQVDPAELRDTLGYGGVPYGTGGPGQLPRAA